MAIALSSSLTRMSSSVRPTLSGRRMVSPSLEAIKNIQGTFIKKGKVRREILEKQNVLKNRRLEKERRKRQEDELEAPNVVARPDGPFEITQKSNKGFLERILGFLGYLGAGWLLNNLPTLIAMGKEFVGRVQRMGQLIGGFVTNITNIFTGFGNLLSATFQNLVQFDLFDTSNRVKDAFGQLTGSVDDMGRELEEALKLITTPLTEGMVTGEDAPPTGQERTSEGAYEPGAPLQTGGGNISSTQRQALDILSKYESAGAGGYNAVNQIGVRGGRGVLGYSGDFRQMKQHGGRALTDMTVAEIMDLQSRRPGMSNQEWINQGRLHAVGRYQFIGNTLPGVVQRSGIPSNAKFTPEVQDLLALQYMKERGIGAWVGPADKATREERSIIERARKEPINYRPSISSGQTSQAQITPMRGGVSTTVRDEINVAGRSGGTALVGLTPGGGRYGAGRGGRRMHKGVDIGTSGQRGYYVAFRQSGTVSYARNNGRGYGNLVIIKSGNIEFYFAHLATILVREGQQYNGETIGEIGGSGGNYAIHLHFEARPGGNPIDPSPYLGLLSIGKQLTGVSGREMNVPISSAPISPAQIASIQSQQQTQQSNQQLSQDRTGPTVIVQEPSEPESQAPSYSGGGAPGMMPLEIDEFTLVNRFIKNKLLLDLAYL
jgi:murein DD-endopeptidase MepM/ murein hydrolase activator NlpD